MDLPVSDRNPENIEISSINPMDRNGIANPTINLIDPLEAAQAQAGQIITQMDELNREIETIVSGDQQAQIEPILNSFYEGSLLPDQALDRLRNSSLTDREFVLWSQALNLESQLREAQSKVTALTLEKVAKESKKLINNIDWQAVFEFFTDIKFNDHLAEDWAPAYSLDNFILQKYADLVNLANGLKDGAGSYSAAQGDAFLISRSLQQTKDKWTKAGFLKTNVAVSQSDLAEEEKELVQASDLKPKIAEIEKYLSYADRQSLYLWIFRVEDIHIPESSVSILEKGTMLFRTAIDNNQPLPAAVVKIILDNCQVFANISQGFFNKEPNIPLKERIDGVQIEGLVAELDEELVVRESDVKDWLKGFPSKFLSKIRIVRKAASSDRREERLADPDAKIWDTVGRFIPTFDANFNLASSEVEVYNACAVPENSSDLVKDIVKFQFKETLYHEIFHRVHYSLTPSEMADWISLHFDDVNVSAYVLKVKNDWKLRSLDNGNGISSISIREDFCESGAFFLSRPGELYDLSPERYKYMYNLFIRNLSPDQMVLFVLIKARELEIYENIKKEKAEELLRQSQVPTINERLIQGEPTNV